MKDKRFDLADLISGLSSVRPGGKPWSTSRGVIKGVAIVGPSCSGKTTLLNKIRESTLCREGKLSVPVRYVTRPQRQNDAPGENMYIPESEFMKMVGGARISFYWKKRMDSAREELFGFAPPNLGALPVYSGNNGLLYNTASVYPRGILDTLLLAGIFAPDEIRKKRLFARSPDLAKDKPEEVRYRLMDTSQAMVSQVHIVIDNYGSQAKNSGRDTVELLKKIWNLC